MILPLFHKKTMANISYDRENLIPAIRASICTGEQVAGFCRKENGRISRQRKRRLFQTLNSDRPS